MIEKIRASKRGKMLIGLTLIIVWSAFVYFAYAYNKNHFDSSIKELDAKYYKNYEATSNEVNDLKTEISNLKSDINILNGNINTFNDNISQIFEDVNGIDSVINDTSVLQKATTDKLEELDRRLIELIENLDILKKAPRE